MTKICLILAATKNGEIGYKNSIPWKLKGDLKRFKALTEGSVVIMGRLTFESLPGPLFGRQVIVVTGDDAFHLRYPGYPGPIYTARNLEAAIRCGKEIAKDITNTDFAPEIFIAGGAKLYEEGLKIADKVFLTLVHKQPDNDCWSLAELVARTKVRVENTVFEPIRYDAVIQNFSLEGFDEIPQVDGVNTIYNTAKDEKNFPVVSHSYHNYVRKPTTQALSGTDE